MGGRTPNRPQRASNQTLLLTLVLSQILLHVPVEGSDHWEAAKGTVSQDVIWGVRRPYCPSQGTEGVHAASTVGGQAGGKGGRIQGAALAGKDNKGVH